MARKVFFSFHFKQDYWRASTVRSIGILEGNLPVNDNDWEVVKRGRDSAIENWIKGQMKGRECTVVLIGNQTANRKWVKYEIQESWNSGIALVGIRIHGLKNQDGYISLEGQNPFDGFTLGEEKQKLSSIVKTYNPTGANSIEKYAWIRRYLSDAVEEAIRIRNDYKK